MATRIRLRRVGRKKKPAYRIVVADKAAPRDGRFLETIGHYDPLTEPATVEVQVERARHWIGVGATPSDTVKSLLKRAGVFAAATE
jgi:small subunit ribosomal protein S16